MKKLRVLGLPGSLRKGSFNMQLLHAAARLAPAGVELCVYERLREIPLFDEDLESLGVSAIPGVNHLRQAIEDSDALLIATPEYNQSMPGVVKNAIDWLSRPPRNVLRGTPVALMGSTVGEWGTRLAQAALRHTLLACGAELIQTPQIYIRRVNALWTESDLDAGTGENLRELMEAIRTELSDRRTGAAALFQRA